MVEAGRFVATTPALALLEAQGLGSVAQPDFYEGAWVWWSPSLRTRVLRRATAVDATRCVEFLRCLGQASYVVKRPLGGPFLCLGAAVLMGGKANQQQHAHGPRPAGHGCGIDAVRWNAGARPFR